MPSPTTLAYWEGLILFGGFFAVVLWKLLSRDIDLDQVFEGDIRELNGEYTTHTSTGRIQAFWVTIYIAYFYLVQVIHNPTQFPTVPDSMVAVLAGSHALYLGGKAQAILFGRLQTFFK
jgi:hypothetical protein